MEHKNDEWWKKEAIYQIYPLSFSDSNGDGYGDLQGIIDRLDYLKELGIGAIWLSPIYPSPMKDWGYDISDYRNIDRRFGDLAAFGRLVEESHGRGMKVMLDFVGNHTSDQHPWFVESKSSIKNPKRDWYVWADPAADGGPPNNWLSAFGGSAWKFDETTGQYYLHSFLESQPDLDWHNPEVRAQMLDTIRFWCDRGVDGFRCDAIWYWAKDRQLSNDPVNPHYQEGKQEPYFSLLHTMSAGQPELAGIVTDITDVLADYPGRFMLSEAYALDLKHLIWMYDMAPRHNYAPFNLNLIGLPWEAAVYRDFIASYDAAVTGEDWPNYVLGNHDRRRVASRVGQAGARMLALMQATLRGTPIIYNGEELGLENVDIDITNQLDPWGLQVPGFEVDRDGERTPMPWTAGPNAGFTSGHPWLPIGPNAGRAAEAQSHDPGSMLSLYRSLLALRRSTEALSTGGLEVFDAGHDEVLAYRRSAANDSFVTVLNFSSSEKDLKLPDGTWELEISTFGRPGDAALAAQEGRLYRRAG